MKNSFNLLIFSFAVLIFRSSFAYSECKTTKIYNDTEPYHYNGCRISIHGQAQEVGPHILHPLACDFYCQYQFSFDEEDRIRKDRSVDEESVRIKNLVFDDFYTNPLRFEGPGSWMEERTLSDYDYLFSTSLFNRLSLFLNRIVPERESIILDSGAGHAVALRELLARKDNKAKLIGVSSVIPIDPHRKKTDRRIIPHLQSLDQEENLFEYHLGSIEKFYEKYADQYQNKISLIFDVLGAFSYSDNISQILRDYTASLKVGGRIYLAISDSRNRVEIQQNSDVLGPREVSFCEWLEEATLIQLIQGVRFLGCRPTRYFSGVVLEKTKDPVIIPALEIVSKRGSFPPYRTIRIVDGTRK